MKGATAAAIIMMVGLLFLYIVPLPPQLLEKGTNIVAILMVLAFLLGGWGLLSKGKGKGRIQNINIYGGDDRRRDDD